MREENFWCKKPRYSEVRVIARRVIARYDCKCTGYLSTNRIVEVVSYEVIFLGFWRLSSGLASHSVSSAVAYLRIY